MGNVRLFYGDIGADTKFADTSEKFLIHDTQGRPSVVLSLSAVAAPGMADRERQGAAAAKARLGTPLGDVILTPLAQGLHNGCSFVVWPYCRSFATFRPIWWLQRMSLRRVLLRWLRCVTEKTLTPAEPDNVEPCFVVPLTALADNKHLERRVRQEALDALDRLMKGRWKAMYVLEHNDFWSGNILRASRSYGSHHTRKPLYPFTLIDWAGSHLHGYAIYDLVRISLSLCVPTARFADELHAHCRLLQCGLADARSHLLASLGMLGLRLEQLPMDRYSVLVKRCCDMLFSCGVAERRG